MYIINLFNRPLISCVSLMRMGSDTVTVGRRNKRLYIIDISELHNGKFLFV
jgi:hypothetical protein